MASSYQQAVSDGTLTTLALSINYLDRSEISVLFDDVLTTAWAWVGTSSKTISFTPAVPAGTVVRVIRRTAADDLRHKFTGGAAFSATTLDENLIQALHIAQEAAEGYRVMEFLQDVNLHGYRLYNVGAATQPNDALTLAQYTVATPNGAATVGYSPNGSTSNVAAKLHEFKSVKDFGAVGDGVADDRPAFEAAAAYIAASARGVNLHIPAGEYRLSAPVTLPNSKSFTMYGDGDASAVYLANGTGAPVMTVGSASTYPTRQVIRDVFFRGPSGGTSAGLRLWNCNTARVIGVVFQNQTAGIILDACYAAEITSNVFDVCTYYGVVGPSTACHNLVLEKNNFFTVGTHAIHLAVASDGVVIDNNDFEYCTVALRADNCTALSFRGNYVEYCSSSIFDFTGTCRNVGIQYNWLAQGTATATVANVVGGTVANNTVYNQTIAIAATCVDVIVGRNYKFGTGTLGASSWNAVTTSGTFSTQGGYYSAAYIKQENGQVQLRGNLINGATGSRIFTLPPGYRPASTATFCTASSASPGVSIVEVRANGDVWCIARDAAGGTGLNGIFFDAVG